MCREQSSVPASVYDQAWQAAEQHKWIESERQRRDLGQAAIDDWDERFFKRFGRWCHWQHLIGKQFFHEFPDSHFNTVPAKQPTEMNTIERTVIHCFWDGQENLNIFDFTHKCGLSGEQVTSVLATLHINEARLDPPVK